MVYAPIWKDTYYTTTADSLIYTIRLYGEVIYSGKAVKMPNADTIKININKVCSSFLDTDIDELFGSLSQTINNNAYKPFTINNSEGTVLETYGFLLDYDYSHNWTGSSATLSLPINGHYTSGMLRLATSYSSSNGYVSTVKTSGTLYPTNVNCGDFAIYYLNARGGWDSFLIEGTATKKDTITTYTIDKSYDNTTYEFEKKRNISEIMTSYVLNTNYLNDEQSEILVKHLLGTNKAYLHSLKEGWIKPINITDTQNTYQTYQTNGRKMSQYKINVELSQSKIRR